MPCKHIQKQPETSSLWAATARAFQSNAELFADTAAPTPPTDNKTLHCYAVPAGDVHAATPVRFWYFRSQGNRNASPYKKSKVENTAVPN